MPFREHKIPSHGNCTKALLATTRIRSTFRKYILPQIRVRNPGPDLSVGAIFHYLPT